MIRTSILIGTLFTTWLPASGSPVRRVICQKEQLTAIKADVQFKVIRFSDESSWAHFSVTWKPKNPKGSLPEPGLFFAVFAQDGPFADPGPGRMRVIFRPDDQGIVRAEFDVALDELARAQVIFMDGQSWLDVLVLQTVVDAFPPEPAEIDPFAPQPEANKAQ